jgi:hypothetical protein
MEKYFKFAHSPGLRRATISQRGEKCAKFKSYIRSYKIIIIIIINKTNKTTWLESASELCIPSDRRLSAKLVPTFAVRGSVAWPARRNLTAVIWVF